MKTNNLKSTKKWFTHWPKWFSKEDIGINTCLREESNKVWNPPRSDFYTDLSGSLRRTRTLTYIHIVEMEPNNVWNPPRSDYYADLSGSVRRRTLTYIHVAKMEPNNLKPRKKWFLCWPKWFSEEENSDIHTWSRDENHELETHQEVIFFFVRKSIFAYIH